MLARHAPRTRDEVAGTGIVTEARPGGHDIALVVRRQRFDLGPAAGELLELRPGLLHRLLLVPDLVLPYPVTFCPLPLPPPPLQVPLIPFLPVLMFNPCFH